MPFLGFVSERMEIPNLVKSPHAVQGVEVVGIARSEFAGFQVARPQIFVLKSARRPAFKKMESKPAAVGAGDTLRFAEKSYKQEQYQIGIDHTLQFQVPRKIFAV